jgi:hypothetical protein
VLIHLDGGIPYGLDGNETFSSIVHAYNLLNFDFSFAKGLADETFSTSAAAHSFVHTHQGNFPRLFATLLYALGLKSPEAQVLATALTVGAGSIVLWFRFVSEVFDRRVAAIATAFLLTDYVLFLQWHLVTYRTWHLFFIAACFCSVQAFARSGDRRWYVALFGIWYGLFYYELLFAIFTATAVGLWTLWILQSRPKLAFRAVAVCFAGAVAGLGTVFVQLILYLGWQGFLQDFLGTFLTRNAAGSVADSIEQIKAFADQHHIVFFLNLIDGAAYRTLDFAISCLTSWGLLVYSPVIAQLILQVTAAAVIHSAQRRAMFDVFERHYIVFACLGFLMFVLPGTSAVLICFAVAAGMLVVEKFLGGGERPVAGDRGRAVGHSTVLLWMVWYSALLADQRTLGDASLASGGFGPAAFILAVAGAGCGSAYGIAAVLGPETKPDTAGRINLFLLVCIACAGIAGVHTLPPSGAFWSQALEGERFALLGPKVILAGSVLALLILALLPEQVVGIADGNRQDTGKETGRRASEPAVLALCVLSALLLVTILLPGYLYSGYMVRYCNFLAPFLTLFFGYGLSWLIGISGRSVANVDARIVQPARVMGIVVVATIALGWCAVQAMMVELIPPGEFARLVAALRQYPGQTVVSKTYAAPFFLSTGAWAYFDLRFGRAETVRSPAGYDYVHDLSYLWFADRDRNPEYRRPVLYVCDAIPLLPEAMERRLKKETTPGRKWGCGSDRLVSLAKSGDTGHWPSPKLLATDAEGGDRWAIMAIDYDFPPYLADDPEAIATINGANLEIDVNYRYRHQAETPEAKSVVSLIALPAGARDCRAEGHTLLSKEAHSGHAHIVLPNALVPAEGSLAVAVEPATATRRGAVEYSAPIDLSNSKSALALNCSMNQHESPR